MTELRIGSLFSGYGGLEQGVAAVTGGRLAWYSEIEGLPTKKRPRLAGPCAILAHRHPGVPNLGDITKVDWLTVGRVDILTGGFPCQDVSPAGKRRGLRPGTRSGLWTHFAYAIDQLQPRLVVIENVRGLLSAKAHSNVEPCAWCLGDDAGEHLRALGAVLADLADIGYDAFWYGLPASDVGAAHGRFRVFIVAHPQGDTRELVHGDGSTAALAPDLGHERAGRARDGRARSADSNSGALTTLPTPTAQDWKNAGDRAKTAGRMAERGQPLTEIAVNVLLPTPAVNDMGEGKTVDGWDEWTAKMKAAHDNGNGQRLLPTPTVQHSARNSTAGRSPDAKPHADGDTLADLVFDGRLLPTPRASDGEKGGPNQRGSSGDLMLPAAVQQKWGDYAPAIARWEGVLGRPAPAPTMTSKKGNPQLSPRFVEWLMGLPEGWVTDVPGITRNEALKALGNGVVPQQAAAAVGFLLATASLLSP